ncbi:MAG: hypothetical protein M8835_06765 [marine benthic group bacterium]|jgi:hypothetical protein|nr:hypothetical protein [Gemmatimonadota bacterium]
MRARFSLVLACAALLAVACQDTPTEPVEQPVAAAPEFNFMNGPKMPGIVTREEGGFVLFDYTRDETEKAGDPWMIWMGWGIDDYHESCEGSGQSNPWVTQAINNRHGIEHSMNQDMDLTVFPFEEFFGNYLSAPSGVDPAWYANCETSRIASGTGHGIDNTTPAGEQYIVHGTIEYMGETYQLKWMAKFFGKDGFMRTMRVK